MLFDIKISKKDVKEYLESIDYPECKIKEYLHIKDNKELQDLYRNIASKQQIHALLNIYHKYNYVFKSYPTQEIKNNLLKIMCKNKDKHIYNIVDKRLKKPFKDDDEIYSFLRTLKSKSKKEDLFPRNLLCNNIEITNQILKYKFKKYLENSKNYLDIGGADGYKSMKVAQTMNIDLEQVYVIDFEEFDGTKYRKASSKIHYDTLELDTKYPYKNSSFHFISAFMVLHHVQNIEFTLKEINRITKMGGYFLIKEHDCIGVIDQMYADVEHAMWEIVWRKEPNYGFRFPEYARYFPWFEWDILLKRYGFERVEDEQYFFNSIHANVSTAKHYFALYKKMKTIS